MAFDYETAAALVVDLEEKKLALDALMEPYVLGVSRSAVAPYFQSAQVTTAGTNAATSLQALIDYIATLNPA